MTDKKVLDTYGMPKPRWLVISDGGGKVLANVMLPDDGMWKFDYADAAAAPSADEPSDESEYTMYRKAGHKDPWLAWLARAQIAQAEVQALRECVKAADAMEQPSMFDSRHYNETRLAYQAARAKVTP